MIDLLGKFLKVLIEENDKLNEITTFGFNICKDNIIRGGEGGYRQEKRHFLKFTSKNIN
jgi:hypothetical protein